MTLKWRAKGSRIRTLTRAFTSSDAEEAAFAARSVADLRTERRRPSARPTTRKAGPRADRSDTTGSRWPASAWWGSVMTTSGTISSKTEVSRDVRGRHRRHGVARSLTASRHCHPDRRRQLSAASARRSDPGSAPHQTTHTGVGLAPAPRSPTKTQEDRSLSRLITVRSICGFFLRPKCRNFTRH